MEDESQEFTPQLTETPDFGSEIFEKWNKDCWGQLIPIKNGLTPMVLTNESYQIGRHSSCDISISVESFDKNVVSLISKVHCRIFCGDLDNTGLTLVYIEDLSSNGTYVNGTKVGKNEKVLLTSADEISLASPRNKVFLFLNKTDHLWLPQELMKTHLVLKHLGSGGFAEVKLVVNKVTFKKFAMKKLLKETIQEKTIFNEVEILRRLQHPCIISLEEVCETPEAVYICLEFMPGGNLYERIKSRKHLCEKETKAIFYQLVLAVKYLHTEGITHRDLKPENVLIYTKPKNPDITLVKVTDFGLSKILHSRTKLETKCGTLRYAAPEVFLASQLGAYDNKIDVWSLGVILYLCLSGNFPFSPKDNNEATIIPTICRGIFRMDDRIWLNINHYAKRLIISMLKVNPSKRISMTDISKHIWFQDRPFLEQVDSLIGIKPDENL